ncbi:MAG: P-II family nitrogen regulator [Bacteroidales bacterium]|jgi:nitrogen regulatory protein P-II 1|nr:P-II family nitrogen regulator [Bacteroidales bacterium]
MKKIEAIIRKTKFEDVKEALHDNGIEFFSFWEARGVGMARQSRVYRGVAYDTSTIERIYLSIVVRDINLERTIKTIIDAAKSGEVGDGKIFVSTIDQSVRIRTGEEGDESLYIKD